MDCPRISQQNNRCVGERQTRDMGGEGGTVYDGKEQWWGKGNRKDIKSL